MEFGLLGPLVVRRGGSDVPVPKGKQRVLLSMLLLNAGHVVPVPALAEALWGPEPPPSAEASIRNYVKRLRHVLGGGERILTRSPGYLIQATHDEVDVFRFESLLEAARAAAQEGAWQDAARQARASLALWRGEPLTDAKSDALALREVPRLAELRVQAMETRLDADLHLGRHAEMIAELERLTVEYPLRERLYSLWMLALYRDARQAEALAVYQRARQVLTTELAVEPGTELQELHRRVLAGDTDLAAPGPEPAEAEPQRVTPWELPSAVPGFTGRSAELEALTRLLDQPGQQAVVISAIGGTAGVGKTALAVNWAHQVAGRFPDGQLYVNLRGYDPGPPVAAADALAAFLRSLGVPGAGIPPGEDERAARYRSLLTSRRMLIVLDNAGSADQVRPLLPGTATCTVLVTSRDVLAGLVVRDGATRLDLDVLPLEDAVALLRALIGTRVDAEPEAAAELAGQCSRLPLALRVAAELAATRPDVPLSVLAGELADLRTRLDLLETDGDLHTQVRTVFSWSCRHLDPDTARAFRVLGLHPGPDFEAYAAAALTGGTVPQARRALDVLARGHLIQPAKPGRYGMHDLLRGYARELSATVDGGREQDAALTRLFDYYLHTAATAMDALFPAERSRRPRIPRPATPVQPLTDPATALDWLEAERAALVTATGYTAAAGWPGHATRLAATISRYLRNGGHFPEALTVFGHALGAAHHNGDRIAEATALNDIGLVHRQQSRLRQAVDRHRQALGLFRAAGDRVGEAQALGNAGLCEMSLGRYELAARHQQQAVAIYRDIGDRFGTARALGNLGLVRQSQGRYQEAADYHRQTLDLFREIGDREGEAFALGRLGAVQLRLGRYQPAAGYIQQARALFHDMGNKADEAEELVLLGRAYAGLGWYEQATENFERALAVFREVKDPIMEAKALIGLGELLSRTGDTQKARTHHASALRLASRAGVPLQEARAHSGLARAYEADGDPLQARHHWDEALTRFAALGAPEADEIRTRLAMASNGRHG